jgi:hypothetical protein
MLLLERFFIQWTHKASWSWVECKSIEWNWVIGEANKVLVDVATGKSVSGI